MLRLAHYPAFPAVCKIVSLMCVCCAYQNLKDQGQSDLEMLSCARRTEFATPSGKTTGRQMAELWCMHHSCCHLPHGTGTETLSRVIDKWLCDCC